MRIAYLVIQMPVPSEVFLSVEIRGLVALGSTVEVFSLRNRHSDYAKLISDQKLSDIPLHNFPLLSLDILEDIFYWARKKPLFLFQLLAVITLTCWRQPAVWLQSLAIVPKSFRIARFIERDQIEVVHAAWGHYPAVTVYLIRHLLPHIVITLALGAYDRASHHPMTVVAANQIDTVLTQSETFGDLIKNDWPKTTTPVQVILRGVEIEHLKPHRGTPQKPGLIATAARLLPHKGHQYLIRALPRILQTYPSAKLIIFGTGSYQAELAALIVQLGLGDSVTLAGHQPQDALFKAVAEASVFALVSDIDWVPNSVKEAMALGIPVVTTPTEGMTELVQDGISGLIAPCGDVNAIAACIIRLLDDPILAKQLSSTAIDHVEKFNIQRTSAQRDQLYRDLLAQKRAPDQASATA